MYVKRNFVNIPTAFWKLVNSFIKKTFSLCIIMFQGWTFKYVLVVLNLFKDLLILIATIVNRKILKIEFVMSVLFI